jgi:hypothetical protein
MTRHTSRIIRTAGAALLAASLVSAIAPASVAREPQAGTAAKASPGTEAALKKMLADLAAGTPDYSMMSEGLANATRQQGAAIKERLNSLGALKSVVFKEVGPQGGDNFDVTYEKGALRFIIMLDANGKVATALMRPL